MIAGSDQLCVGARLYRSADDLFMGIIALVMSDMDGDPVYWLKSSNGNFRVIHNQVADYSVRQGVRPFWERARRYAGAP